MPEVNWECLSGVQEQGGVSNPNRCRLACCPFIDSLVAQMVKNSPANVGDAGLTPGSRRFPGEGNGSPLQYSCLENPMDRGVWQAIKSDTIWLNVHMWKIYWLFFFPIKIADSQTRKGKINYRMRKSNSKALKEIKIPGYSKWVQFFYPRQIIS